MANAADSRKKYLARLKTLTAEAGVNNGKAVFLGQSVDDTPLELFILGDVQNARRIDLPEGETIRLDLRLKAREPDLNSAGSSLHYFMVTRAIGGALSITAPVTTNPVGLIGAAVYGQVDVVDDAGNIAIQVTGVAATVIDWTVVAEIVLG